ncbi:MAG: dockerin type I domain-containing protein [Oscillospiraceae bacterium]|nr:dockerin type I domain-containing protein [Oscillospiraceae bacterium]
MKKFVAMLSAAVLTAVSIPFSASAEDLIAVNAANFPDDNFRSYISSELDDDGNGYLDTIESFCVNINLYNAGEIKSLKGIELLTDLRDLNAYGLGLTEIDVSKNINLEDLTISKNNLSEINVSNNINLESLSLSENNISSVDISKNVNLEYLDISSTGISNIDLSRCPKLTFLDCNETPITSLDLSAVPLLEYIDIYKCNMGTLDISKNTALKKIYAREAGLTELDLSGHPELEEVELLYNEIPIIDTSNCPALKVMYIQRNPITVLDVSNSPLLEILQFSECNGITEIDVSKNTALQQLVTNNVIDELDVTNNPKLQWLDCRGTKITELDLSNNKELNTLLIDSCSKITNIDLSNNPLLDALWCSGCNLPFMNLDAQTAVTDFRKPSGISSANIKGETFDMAQFPEGFDISRVTGVKNAVLDGTVLTVIDPRQPIEYTYNAGGSVGEISYKIGISSVELTQALAREIPPQEYTGSEVCPFPELYCGEEQITAIDLEYSNNTEIGTASVTVTMDENATLYNGSVTLEFEITKATPEYEVPTGLSAIAGQKLGTIELPKGFSWEEPDTVLDSAGTVNATVSYTPEDTEHYLCAGGIKVSVTVTEPLKGDVNMDGKTDIADAALILKCYAEMSAGKDFAFSDDQTANEKMLKLADVNEDGNTDITDARLVLMYYAKISAGMDISWEEILK